MVFDDYGWSAYPENGPVSSEISHEPLDRKDGGQMLDFLNACARLWHWLDNLASLRNLERVTRQIVPRNRLTQQEVKSWIEHYTPVL